MDVRSFAGRWATDVCFSAGLTSLGLLSFRSSYGGWRFLLVGMACALIGGVIGAVLSSKRPPLLVGVAVSLICFLLIGGVIALPQLALVGVVPNAASVRGAVHGTVFGWKELITTAPPVAGIGVLMVVPAFCGWFGASTSVVMAGRQGGRLWPLLPPFVVAALSIVTGVKEPAALIAQGVGLAAGSLVWLIVRDRRLRSADELNIRETPNKGVRPWLAALATLAASGLLGFVIGPRLPLAQATDRTLWRKSITPPLDLRQFPSPLSSYRSYREKEAKDVVHFTVEGPIPSLLRLRVATMDNYDGVIWTPSNKVSSTESDDFSTVNAAAFIRAGNKVQEPADDSPVRRYVITVGAPYHDVWVPDIGRVIALRFEGSAGGGQRDETLNQSLRVNRGTNTAVAPVRLAKGDRYVVDVQLDNEVSLANLDKQVVDDRSIVVSNAEVPKKVGTWTLKQVAATTSPAEKLWLVANNLFTNGAYSDGDRDQLPAGHFAGRLEQFVGNEGSSIVGNGEQYAATMAIAARVVAVNSRVAIGFVVKDIPPSTTSLEITGGEVAAWTEVHTAAGWISIDATPPVDQTVATPQPPSAGQPLYRTQVPPSPPSAQPSLEKPFESETKAADPPEKPEAPAPSGGVPTAVLVGGAVVGLPLLLFGLVVGVITWLKLRRRKRRRTTGATHERIANGWQEFTDNAVDIGKPVPTTATRREAAQFVAPGSVALAERADAAVFGPAQPTDDEVDRYWTDLTAQLDAMHSELSFTERIKARLSISSFTRPQRSAKRSNTGKGSR